MFFGMVIEAQGELELFRKTVRWTQEKKLLKEGR